MVLAGHAHRLYTLGAYRWPGSRQDILGHLLTVRDWPALLDPTRVRVTNEPPASRKEQ